MSHPALPVETGSHPTSEGYVHVIDVQGDFAYAAEKYHPSYHDSSTGRLTILDISDPDRLSFVDRLSFGDALLDIQLSDESAVAVTAYFPRTVHYDDVYPERLPKLELFDVSVPEPASSVGEHGLTMQSASDVALNGATLWVADGSTTLQVCDVGNGVLWPGTASASGLPCASAWPLTSKERRRSNSAQTKVGRRARDGLRSRVCALSQRTWYGTARRALPLASLAVNTCPVCDTTYPALALSTAPAQPTQASVFGEQLASSWV